MEFFSTRNVNEKVSAAQAIAQGYTVIKTATDLKKIHYNLSGKYILMNERFFIMKLIK